MAVVNGTNYDHIDIMPSGTTNVTRHKLQDTDGRAMLAPTEASSTASAAHATGTYFIYGGVLYQATADIASGGTITPGTNCKEAPLGDSVSDLKSALTAYTDNVTIQFTNGKYIQTNVSEGTEVDLTPLTPTSNPGNNNYAIVDASGGDVFIINGTGGNNGRLWAFVDSSNKLIIKSDANETGSNLILTAPGNASKLILNEIGTVGLCTKNRYISDIVKYHDHCFTKIPILNLNISFTRTDGYEAAASREFVFAPLEKGKRYKITLKIHSIPTTNKIALSTSLQKDKSTKKEDISGDIYNLGNSTVCQYDFTPNYTTGFIYLYALSDAGSIDVDVVIDEIKTESAETAKNYKRIGYIKKSSENTTAQRIRFPFVMKTGNQYNFRVFANIINANTVDNDGSTSYGTISAELLSGNGDSYTTHDRIVRISGYDLTDTDKTGKVSRWFNWNYTATHDTDYLDMYMRHCDAGSELAIEVLDTNFSLPEFIYNNNFSIRNHGNRMICDIKNYPFKRIGAYSGTGQGIVERSGDIFVFTNGTMYRYRDLNVISTSTKFFHPINASIMANGNIMVSDITDYNTENEVRHIYEYNPDTDTLVHDYTPTVTDKHLVLSEEIDSGTILAAFKNDNETTRIIYWYAYDISEETITYISETEHDRTFTQGCSLRGGMVYVMTNDGGTVSADRPPKMLAIELETGEIKNETKFYHFGETEGFFVTYSEAPGAFAFMLDNGDKYMYLIKLC